MIFDQILSTFKFTNTGFSGTTPTVQAKSLYYNLPVGWKTVKDSGENFEIGYDPNVLKVAEAKYNSVFLAKIQVNKGNSFGISLVPYDGGSRHTFIFQQLGQDPQQLDSEERKYTEKNYLYNGKSGLVFYGYRVSQIGNPGMFDAGKRQAFFFTSFADQLEMEKYLSTIKLLK